MRIFAKKALRFRGGDKAVSVAALSFADVPDWVRKDPLFGLATQEGTIEIITSKADERKAENGESPRGSRGRGKGANQHAANEQTADNDSTPDNGQEATNNQAEE